MGEFLLGDWVRHRLGEALVIGPKAKHEDDVVLTPITFIPDPADVDLDSAWANTEQLSLLLGALYLNAEETRYLRRLLRRRQELLLRGEEQALVDTLLARLEERP